MDARIFDDITRAPTAHHKLPQAVGDHAGHPGPTTRRRLLGLAAVMAAPLAGITAVLRAPQDDALAKDRRRRRKQRHKRRHTSGRNHPRADCTPRPRETVCAGQCGAVKSRQTCGKTVDCGPCACSPACAACHSCDPASQTCVDQCPGACCQGSCTDLQMDDAHCGACGLACSPAMPVCCAGGCVDLQTDAAHCGACGNACPACQTCQAGKCAPVPALQHACGGPCPTGEWCHAGAGATIASTVTIPDCHSLCSGSTTVCGQTVTCPACSNCMDQTGCGFALSMQEGPVGPGSYCAFNPGGTAQCTSNANCAGDPTYPYCAPLSGMGVSCARTCPY